MIEILITFIDYVPRVEHCKGDRKSVQLMYRKLDARHFLRTWSLKVKIILSTTNYYPGFTDK